MPSTIVPATVGFWWASTTTETYETALYTVPAGMLVNALFLYCWRIFPTFFPTRSLRVLLVQVTLAALAVWAVLAIAFVSLAQSEWIPIQVLGFGCVAIQVFAGVATCWSDTPAPAGARRADLVTLLLRGVLAGSAIGFSVWLASLGSPLLAGMASVFPAIFLTTMISTWLTQGKAVPMGAVGPIMLGSSSVSAYALSAIWTLPWWGALWGSIASWLFAVCVVSVPAWIFLRRRPRGPGADP